MSVKSILSASLLAAIFGSGAVSAQEWSISSTTAMAGATDVGVTATYTAGGNVVNTTVTFVINDPDSILTNIRFQQWEIDLSMFPTITEGFVNCDSNAKLAQTGPNTEITCVQADGRYFASAGVNVMPNLPERVRVLFDVDPTATEGQFASITFGELCADGVGPGTGCSEFVDNQDPGQRVAGTVPVFDAVDPVQSVLVVALEGPTVVFDPPAGALALPGGVQGGTATSVVNASTTASPGEEGGDPATVTCTITAGMFDVTPNTEVTFTSGTASSQDFSVSCVRPNEGDTALVGTMTCAVSDQVSDRNEVYELTCPVGTAIPGPTLSFDPDGGPFPLPGGLIDTTASRGISVVVDEPGEEGGPSSTATCTGDAVFSVTGSPVTVEAGSSTGGTITVSCTRTDMEQEGTVTCNIDGGADVTFNAVCPAGSTFILPPPQQVPTMSNWGLYTLILVMLGLGAGFAYRRLG
jgi:hypothetical protein